MYLCTCTYEYICTPHWVQPIPLSRSLSKPLAPGDQKLTPLIRNWVESCLRKPVSTCQGLSQAKAKYGYPAQNSVCLRSRKLIPSGLWHDQSMFFTFNFSYPFSLSTFNCLVLNAISRKLYLLVVFYVYLEPVYVLFLNGRSIIYYEK